MITGPGLHDIQYNNYRGVQDALSNRVPQDGLHVLCVPCVVNNGMLVPVPELMVHSPLIGSLLCRYVSVAVWTP